MDFVGNYPTEEKVNNAKVQIYQPLSSCFDSNSTFHDTAMCIGHLVNFTMEQWKIVLRKNGSGCGLADSLPHAIQRREARHGERVLR